jgi:hypothetical protein
LGISETTITEASNAFAPTSSQEKQFRSERISTQ